MNNNLPVGYGNPLVPADNRKSPLKTLREVTIQLQNLPDDIGNYFEFLTGKKQADPTNLVDMWIKNRIIPLTKGFDPSKKARNKSLLNVDTLTKNIDVENVVVLICKSYQIVQNRLKKTTDADEQAQLNQAIDLLTEQLDSLVTKHPHQFTQPNFASRKFNPNHVSDRFRQELQWTDAANNHAGILKILAIGGLILSGGFLGSFFGGRASAPTSTSCGNALTIGNATHIASPQPPMQMPIPVPMPVPAATIDLNVHDIVEMTRLDFNQLQEEAAKSGQLDQEVGNLRAELDESRIALENLRNNPSEEGQVLYRQQRRESIKENVDATSSECAQKMAINDLIALMQLQDVADSDYKETYELATDIFVNQFSGNSNVEQYARKAILDKHEKFSFEFNEKILNSWLSHAESIPETKEIILTLTSSDLGCESVRKVFANHIKAEASAARRLEILKLLNSLNFAMNSQTLSAGINKFRAELNEFRAELNSKSELQLFPEPAVQLAASKAEHNIRRVISTKSIEVWTEAAKAAVSKWDSNSTEIQHNEISSLVSKLDHEQQFNFVITTLESWLGSNVAYKTNSASSLVGNLAGSTNLKDKFGPAFYAVVNRVVNDPAISSHYHTRAALLKALKTWTGTSKDMGKYQIDAATIVLNKVALSCTQDEWPIIKDILENLAKKQHFELAKTIAQDFIRNNRNDKAAEVFVILLNNVPLSHVPTISEAFIKAGKAGTLSPELLGSLKDWSAKDYRTEQSMNGGADIASAINARTNAMGILLKNTLIRGSSTEVEKAFKILENLLQKNEGLETFESLLENVRIEHAHLALRAIETSILNIQVGKEISPQMRGVIKTALNKWKGATQEDVIIELKNLLNDLTTIKNYEFQGIVASQWIREGNAEQIKFAGLNFRTLFKQPSFDPSDLNAALENIDEAHAPEALQLLKFMVESGYCTDQRRVDVVRKAVASWKLSKDAYHLTMAAVAKDFYDVGTSYATALLQPGVIKDDELADSYRDLAFNVFSSLFDKRQGFKEFTSVLAVADKDTAPVAIYLLNRWVKTVSSDKNFDLSDHAALAEYRPISQETLDKWIHKIDEASIVSFAETLVQANGFYEPVRDHVLDGLRAKNGKFIGIKFYKILKTRVKSAPERLESNKRAILSNASGNLDGVCYIAEDKVPAESAHRIKVLEQHAKAEKEHFHQMLHQLSDGVGAIIPMEWFRDASTEAGTTELIVDLLDFDLERATPETSHVGKTVKAWALELSESKAESDRKIALKLYTKLASRGIWIRNQNGKNIEEPALKLASELAKTDLKGVTEFLIEAIDKGFIGLRDSSLVATEICDKLIAKEDISNDVHTLNMVYKLVEAFAVKGKSEEFAIKFIAKNKGDFRGEVAQFVYDLSVYLDGHGQSMRTNEVLDFWQTSAFVTLQEKAFELASYMINRKDVMRTDLDQITIKANNWRQKSKTINSAVARVQATKLYSALLTKEWDNNHTFVHALDAAHEAIVHENLDVRSEGQALFNFMYATFEKHAGTETGKNRLSVLNQKKEEWTKMAKDVSKGWGLDMIGMGDHKSRVERSLRLFGALTSNEKYRNDPGFKDVIPYIKKAVDYGTTTYKMEFSAILDDIVNPKK